MTRLLIIDDHEMVREGLKAMLITEPDFDIVGGAANGRQALEMAERLHPDLVLLDLRLPDMSGVEVCQTLSQQFPKIGVIILTTFTDERLMAECIHAGAKGFIIKDVERFDLKHSIRAVARGEATIDLKTVAAMPTHSQANVEQQVGTLSAQQLVIVRLVAQGLSSREIGLQLYLSENTVKGYVQEILHHLGVKNRTEAVMVAVRQGWL